MRAVRLLSATYLLAACAAPSSSGDKSTAAEHLAADSAAIVGVTGRLVAAAGPAIGMAGAPNTLPTPCAFRPTPPLSSVRRRPTHSIMHRRSSPRLTRRSHSLREGEISQSHPATIK